MADPARAIRSWRRLWLLGVPVDDLTMTETLDAIDDLIAQGSVHQHVVVNVSKVVQASRDPDLAEVIGACAIVNADGQPILWAARLLGTRLRERVAGVDLMVRLIERAEERGHRLYFLGARRDVVEAVVARVEAEHPRVTLAGHRDGYWSPDEEGAIVAAIAATGPDIVFVAIGSPMKERFLARWKDVIGAPFVMGVGGSFDVYAGRVQRAPRWMRRIGLEWLFRIGQEPRRMWRRYLGDAPRFALLVARARLRRDPVIVELPTATPQ